MSDGAQEITLNGSAEIVCDYLGKWKLSKKDASLHLASRTPVVCTFLFPEVAISAIMFQRGVHAAKKFNIEDYCNVNIFKLNGDDGFHIKETVRSLKGKAIACRLSSHFLYHFRSYCSQMLLNRDLCEKSSWIWKESVLKKPLSGGISK